MSGQARRDLALVEKQEWMQRELDAFRREAFPETADLPWDVRRILQQVHKGLFQAELNVGAVLEVCHLRNNNATTRFRCQFGMGLRKYIEALRIDAACRLLPREDLEIYLISMALGYHHQETFYQAFRRQMHCTPAEYRVYCRSGSSRSAVSSG